MTNKIIILNNWKELKHIYKIFSELGILVLKSDSIIYYDYPISISNYIDYNNIHSCGLCANCLTCNIDCNIIKNKEIITYKQFVREEKLKRILT